MIRTFAALAGMAAILSQVLVAVPTDEAANKQAAEIFAATEARNGFIVQVGCGNGHLTAALSRGGKNLVHGLSLTHEGVDVARDYIRSVGFYGSVSIEQLRNARLPYIDSVVNLVVSDDRAEIAEAEFMRVLAPRGIAYIKKQGTWTVIRKPVPQGTDEWTHFYHDASGNPVSNDDWVAPPRHMQWEAGPMHTRSHEFTSSVSTIVTGNGRLFYFSDVGSVSTLRAPAKWEIVARDAYNGVELWRRPVDPWYSHLCCWTGTPRELQRRLVIDGDRLFATLGYFGEVQMLDAVTGETLKTFPETLGAEEIIFHKGKLLVVVRKVTDEKLAEFEKMAGLTRKPESPLHTRDDGRPLFRAFRKVERSTRPSIMVIDPESGDVLWQITGEDVQNLSPLSLRAAADWVVYQAKQVRCRNLADGSPVWAKGTPKLRCLDERVLVCSNNTTATAYRTATGEPVWTQDLLLSVVRDVFIIGDSVWLGGFKPFDTGSKKYTGPVWGPHFATERSIETGEVLKHIETENPGHHHRCYDNVATHRYMLVGRRGTEFYDLKTGDIYWNNWARGVCRYGVMPANGLLYKPPHSCGCYITRMLHGFTALFGDHPTKDEPTIQTGTVTVDDGLERGPAYENVVLSAEQAVGEWPVYRSDKTRSAYVAGAVPSSLVIAWKAGSGQKATPPTVAAGKVFTAIPNLHQVIARDQVTGTETWTYTAGGRIDSPPTIYRGLVFFGCRDGCVYCLQGADGTLVWRFRAANSDRRTVINGQLEALKAIPGSVLIDDDVLVFSAGRSSFLDDGIDIYRLEPATGKVLSKTTHEGPEAKSVHPVQYNRNEMPGTRWDLLTADAEHLYLQDLVLDEDGVKQDSKEKHLFALTGFLDDSWTHRSYWIYGDKASISTGCSGQMRGLLYGRLLAVSPDIVFGYGRSKVHWSNEYDDGPYRLFARKEGEPQPKWTCKLPIQVNAMAATGDAVLVAGAPGPYPGTQAESGEDGASLYCVAAEDGAVGARVALPATPVFDGMAVSNGHVYVSLQNGDLICLAGK